MACEGGLNEIIARNSSGMREMCRVRAGPPTDATASHFYANLCSNATQAILSILHDQHDTNQYFKYPLHLFLGRIPSGGRHNSAFCVSLGDSGFNHPVFSLPTDVFTELACQSSLYTSIRG